MAKSSKINKFQFKKKDPGLIEKKAKAFSNDGDDLYKGDPDRFTPEVGKNKVRLLPANEEYWGVEMHTHWVNVDGKNRPYACPRGMSGEACPICEERQQALKDDDQDYASECRASQRLLVWCIDRNKEDEGPKLWDIPRTIEIDINGGAVDEDTNEVLPLDDPLDGYDITFQKEGKGINTKYSAVNISRRSTPLSDDEDTMVEWLEKMDNNPLDEIVNVYDYDYLKSVFEGKPAPKKGKSETDEAPEPDNDDGDDDKDPPFDPNDDDMMADSEESDDEDEDGDESPASNIRDRLKKRKG